MAKLNKPVRLREDPQFKEALLGASKYRWSPERLQLVEDALKKRLETLPHPHPSSGETRLLSKLASKIGLVIFVGAAATSGWYFAKSTSDSTPIRPLYSKQESIPKNHPKTTWRQFRLIPQPDKATPLLQREQPIEPRTKKGAPSSPPPTSQLPPQLARLHQAQRLHAARQCSASNQQIMELLQAYPNSPLIPEARLLRLHNTICQKRPKSAIAQINALLSEPSLFPKKAELLRLQGDLMTEVGDCPQAQIAFRRAIGLEPYGPQGQLARAGLKKCSTLLKESNRFGEP